MTTIVGVHGVGNLIDGAEPLEASRALGRLWGESLGAASAQSAKTLPFQVVIAYYAHHLAPVGIQGSDPRHLTERNQLATAMTLAWAQQLGAPEPIAQGHVTRPVRALISWIAQRFGLEHRMVHWFVERFFTEVASYFSNSAMREAAVTTILDTVRRHDATVVVAHSLGSVLAYEALWQPSAPSVDHLVTLGSPLALPDIIYQRLTPPPQSKGARPPAVRRWTDVADVGDLIAIPRPLSRYFDSVDQEHRLAVAPFDFHRVANYLRSGVVATAIAAA